MAETLRHTKSPLASASHQNEVLNNGLFTSGQLPYFKDCLRKHGYLHIEPSVLEVFQINLGYMCNQTCKHCHVDAGPERKEIMDRATMEICLEKINEFGAETVDLTGGAPELNPNFRFFVTELGKLKVKEIIVRSNLTIIRSNQQFADLPEFFRDHGVRVVSSLPFYNAGKTDRQRGNGVFEKSIEALKSLNAVGYGKSLKLDLVYNPSGAYLPGTQLDLEREFKKVLERDHGVIFNDLLALTNLPISRFLDYLLVSGNYESYMEKLVESFNPFTVDGLMCRNTISVSYDGKVYDCDFNQMLELGVETQKGQLLVDLDLKSLLSRKVMTGQHCYGCTAGAGSSCQGATV